MPVLLYSCENWVLTEQLISHLETFQGELAKRNPELPRWASNMAANAVMGWTTVRARVVVQKLSFLHRLVSAERESVGSRALVSMGDDVEALCLVENQKEFLGPNLLRSC